MANTLGNPFWAGAGFSASFPRGNLASGLNVLGIYAHTPTGAGGTSRST